MKHKKDGVMKKIKHKVEKMEKHEKEEHKGKKRKHDCSYCEHYVK